MLTKIRMIHHEPFSMWQETFLQNGKETPFPEHTTEQENRIDFDVPRYLGEAWADMQSFSGLKVRVESVLLRGKKQ